MKHRKLLIAGVLMTASTVALAEPSEGFRLNTGVYLDEGDPLIGLGYEIPVSANASIIPGAEYVFVDNGPKSVPRKRELVNACHLVGIFFISKLTMVCIEAKPKEKS